MAYLEAAIVLDLHSRDDTTRQVVAKFSLASLRYGADSEKGGEMIYLSNTGSDSS